MAGQIINRGTRKWLVRVYLGEVDGKRKYHNKTINGNRKDAERYLHKALLERDTTGFIEPSSESLSAYLDRWLKIVVKQRVTAKTYQSYQDIVNTYIKTGLKDMPLSKLTSERIQDFYNSLLDKPLSSRTVRYTHSVLRSALSQAVKWNMLHNNPCNFIDLPKQKKQEMKVLTTSEAYKFMEAIVYSKWKPFFSLLLASGMRPGEALGLKWMDVDFGERRIQVQRALSKTKAGWKLEDPKTPQSRRSIPIPPSVMGDLQEHKENQESMKKKDKYNDIGLVFTNDKGEPPDLRSIFVKHFKPLLKQAELPDIRLYDLRHTCATLLLSAGVNPKIVAERLGHSSITLTLDTYSHVLPTMQIDATEKLENMLFDNKNTKSSV